MNNGQIDCHRADIKNTGDKGSTGVRRLYSQPLKDEGHGRANQNTDCHRDKEGQSDDEPEIVV